VKRAPALGPAALTALVLEQPGDGQGEAFAAAGQGVLGVGGTAGDQATLDDPRRLELLQPLREGRR